MKDMTWMRRADVRLSGVLCVLVVAYLCMFLPNYVKKSITKYTECPPGHFMLSGMTACHTWLTCHEINSQDFRIIGLVGQGAVKQVYLAEWRGHKVALNSINNQQYAEDFLHGQQMLQAFHGSPFVTQYLGDCLQTFVTEYHELGSAEQLNAILKMPKYVEHDTLDFRLSLCIRYSEILHFLHNSIMGCRVMCDSNDLQKTLNQYLFTSDLELIVNDLDALPETDRHEKLVKCGHRELWGEFVAPEQTWPYEDREFQDSEMPPYDEKADIWKIPDICDYFLGDIHGADIVRLHMFSINKQCKSRDPTARPTAGVIVKHYTSIREQLRAGSS